MLQEEGGNGGETKQKETYLRAVSREQNELISQFKMAAGDVIIALGGAGEVTG